MVTIADRPSRDRGPVWLCAGVAHDGARTIIGRYRLVEVLGEGGMGAAWRAHDERMGRDVVLKQLKLSPALDATVRGQLVARMEREARTAGRLKHPNIVTVHDQFHDESGLPWIVMELIRGPSLAGVVEGRGPLEEREAARIGAQVASALAAAHEAGIVHRDIKPANVLIEGDRVVVTDFGIAAVSDEVTLTPYGALLGTPAYMAPEQVNDREATPASDVWSLGTTLYAAVEGRRAFTGTSTAALLLAVARGRPEPLVRARLLAPLLLELLHFDPARRPTAAEAATALAAIAAGTQPAAEPATKTAIEPAAEPAIIRPRPPREKSGPSRRTLLIGLGAVGVAVAVPTGYLLSRPDDPPSGSPLPRWNHTPTLLEEQLSGHTDDVRAVAFSPDGRFLVSGGLDSRVRVWSAATADPVGRPLTDHTAAVNSVAFSPDGGLLATGGRDNLVRFWYADTWSSSGEPLAGHSTDITSMAFSPDGKILASGCVSDAVRLWNTADREQTGKQLSGHDGTVTSVVFSPDGRILVTAGADSTVRLWNTDGWNQVGAPLAGHAGEVTSVAFSPNGKILASGGADGTARLWDTASWAPIGQPLTGHAGEVHTVAFSPDGGALATGGADKTVRLWDVATRTPIGTPLTAHTDAVRSVAFSPNGRLLATGSDDGTIRWYRL